MSYLHFCVCLCIVVSNTYFVVFVLFNFLYFDDEIIIKKNMQQISTGNSN
jgi:hypothetical protein